MHPALNNSAAPDAPPDQTSRPTDPEFDSAKLTVESSVGNLVSNNTIASSSSTLASNLSCKYIKDLNDLVTCNLCKGYLIDATTIIECLHSFCRTCIVKYIGNESSESKLCPSCNLQIHKTKPKLNIRSDPTLQDIVYKLVPNLYKNEMGRRKEFYSKHPDKVCGLSNEEKGEIYGERLILSSDDNIQLTIEYFPEVTNPYKLLPFKSDENQNSISSGSLSQRRYLLCKAGMKVSNLIKFIRYKYDLDPKIEVSFFYKHELLKDDYTIMDLAYIYSWRRNVPIPLYYIIVEPDKRKDDYLWLFPNSKLSYPRSSTKKRRLRNISLEKTKNSCTNKVGTPQCLVTPNNSQQMSGNSPKPNLVVDAKPPFAPSANSVNHKDLTENNLSTDYKNNVNQNDKSDDNVPVTSASSPSVTSVTKLVVTCSTPINSSSSNALTTISNNNGNKTVVGNDLANGTSISSSSSSSSSSSIIHSSSINSAINKTAAINTAISNNTSNNVNATDMTSSNIISVN